MHQENSSPGALKGGDGPPASCCTAQGEFAEKWMRGCVCELGLL